MIPLVSTKWLAENQKKVRIIDASWHLPNEGRNAYEEYLNSHIVGSVFFDLDKNSNQETNIPHMLPNKENWQKLISSFGIKNEDFVVIYDNSDLISSCRCWFSFLYFGHNPNLVSVLNGGLKKWNKEKRLLTKEIVNFNRSNYLIAEKKNLIVNKNEIDKNILSKVFEVVDARNAKRFKGLEKEPRAGIRSGSIQGSKNLPFKFCINNDNTFKSKEELKQVFNNLKLNNSKDVIFSCGSGVTACILGLANSIISGKTPKIYDGSWAEYGLIKL